MFDSVISCCLHNDPAKKTSEAIMLILLVDKPPMIAYSWPMDERGFPTALPEFQRVFPDEAACASYLESLRWPKGFI